MLDGFTRPTVNGASCNGWRNSGAFATTHVDAGDSYQSADCGGTEIEPVFATFVLNTTYSTSLARHVVRHEIGHGLRLGDTSHSCWTTGTTVFPLMKNSTVNCTSYGSNTKAHATEVSAAKAWNGW